MIVYANEFFFPNCLEKHKLDKNRILMNTVNFLSSLNLITRFFVSVVALVAAALCNAEPESSPSVLSQIHTIDSGCLTPHFDDQCERWVSIYDNPNGHSTIFDDQVTGVDEATAEAISPQGDRVYVTGYSWDNSTQGLQWATVALDSRTGARLWVARRGKPAFAYDIAVSPDGSRIYVVGADGRQQQGQFYGEGTVVAYDAATGHKLWLAHDREPVANVYLEHVAVSPDGTRVYVSGEDAAGGDFGHSERYVTIAYSASTGSQEWLAFHENPQLENQIIDMAVDPTGARVYVSGTGGIVAYDAATGSQLWATTDRTSSMTIAADGSRLFALRQRGNISGYFDLVAYASSTGRVPWSVSLPHTLDYAPPIVADPKGAKVYVATSQDLTGPNDLFQNVDAVTMAFKQRSGDLAWTADYNDPRWITSSQKPFGIAVSPDGKRLYLDASSNHLGPSETGISEIATVAYNAAEGSQQWVSNFHASPEDFDIPAVYAPARHSVGVTPDGSKVIVAGLLNHHPFAQPNDLYPDNRTDYVTLAYDSAVAPGVRALKAVSRKVQGAAGVFDLVGIECRSGGPDNRYQMAVSFPSAVAIAGAAITSGIGNVVGTTTNGAEVTVDLTGVANAQTITLTLLGVSDGRKTNDVPVTLSVLVGDSSASGSVTTDVDLNLLVTGQSGQPVTTKNFREDVTADGLIDNSDVSLVKSKVGTVLPQ